MHHPKIISGILMALLALSLSGQKVGVVLSGGGSRGIAHVGVLKALEEEGIPIDYIAGTSMGALVGGLYAIGYSPAEIDSLLSSEEFASWARGQIDKKYTYYFKRSPANASWISFRFDIDSAFQPVLPANLISPYLMDFAFMEHFSATSALARDNFDSLFVPFRCVGADITNSKEVVFRDGCLGDAIRASITFPFVIRPIEIRNSVIFDGGMFNNFPADVMQAEFNPDYIIGSKVADNYAPPSADDVLSQIRSIMMENTEYTVGNSGYLIEPIVPKLSLLDFSRSRELIDSGYTATKRAIPQIKADLAKSRDPGLIHARRKAFRERVPSLVFQNTLIKGLNKKQAVYIKKLLFYKSTYRSAAEMKSDYFRLLADDKISYIYPRAVYDTTSGYFDLVLDVSEANDLMVEFGGNVSSSAINGAFIGIQYQRLGRNALSLAANSNIGRFYNAGQLRLKYDLGLNTPFYLQLSLSLNQWDYFKSVSYFYEENRPSYLVQNDYNACMAAAFPLSYSGKLQAGFRIIRLDNEYYQNSDFSEADTADKSRYDLISPYLNLEWNTLNRKQFASNGILLKVGLRYFDGDAKNIPGSTSIDKNIDHHDFNAFILKFYYENYFEHIGKLRLGFVSELLLSNMKFTGNYTSTMLSAPGFQPTPHATTIFLPNYRAHNYAGIGMRFIHPIVLNFDLRLEAYLFQPYQAIEEKRNQDPGYGEVLSSRESIGNIALIYHSPLGPVSASLAYYSAYTGHWAFMLNLGYIIHNGKSFE